MADETVMTPVEGAEPPKANPLAKPAASSSTLTLKPVARPASGLASGLKLPPKSGLPSGLKLPGKPGLATSGLKLPGKPGLSTGLKLPPKPGLATQTGLKLPPKPGLATQTGLKLPPKPGLATSGLKLPTKTGATQTGLRVPTKPTIHKPGTAPTHSTLSGLKKPTLLGATKPAAAAAPAAPAAAAPVELTPLTPTELAPAEKPLEALKSATQNLKSLTAPIPQQAILRKTGIIAEDKEDAALVQAAKSKTSRISLSEAMGAAPVSNENMPMKTIRIRRPIDIPGVAKTDAPASEATTKRIQTVTLDAESKQVVAGAASTAAADPAAAGAPAPAAEGEKPAESGVTMTQRKTLKISRPAGGAVRPSGKFGIKRPGTMMTAKTTKPAGVKPAGAPSAAVKPEGAAAPAEGGEVADIPSLPTAPVPVANVPGEKPIAKGFSITSILIQIAACATMGVLAWWLYNDTQILPF